jgi:hypothetical protein
MRSDATADDRVGPQTLCQLQPEVEPQPSHT